jgi:hypothetical protein
MVLTAIVRPGHYSGGQKVEEEEVFIVGRASKVYVRLPFRSGVCAYGSGSSSKDF